LSKNQILASPKHSISYGYDSGPLRGKYKKNIVLRLWGTQH